MRLNNHQKESIIAAVKTIDPQARVWLFGSRVDDNKKGGDIDIAIYSEEIHKDAMKVTKVKRYVCNRIGEQRIDIITTKDGSEPIFRLAKEEGIELL